MIYDTLLAENENFSTWRRTQPSSTTSGGEGSTGGRARGASGDGAVRTRELSEWGVEVVVSANGDGMGELCRTRTTHSGESEAELEDKQTTRRAPRAAEVGWVSIRSV